MRTADTETREPFWGSNEALLIEICLRLGAKRLHGSAPYFFQTPANWMCPSCHRNKFQIAKLTSTGSLLTNQVRHHDHFGDWAFSHLGFEKRAIARSLVRFEPVIICQDCNHADTKAKMVAGAGEHFSFTPYEISYFSIYNGVWCGIDDAKALEAYEAAKHTMHILLKRVREEAKKQVQ